MSSLILWIDTQHANIYHFLPSGMQKENLNYEGVLHPVETAGANHPIHQTDEERFYHQVCKKLEKIPANEWLVMGSGPGPDHFINHLESHHPHFAKRVLNIQKVPKMTEAQLIDYGMAFFKHAHVFQGL